MINLFLNIFLYLFIIFIIINDIMYNDYKEYNLKNLFDYNNIFNNILLKIYDFGIILNDKISLLKNLFDYFINQSNNKHFIINENIDEDLNFKNDLIFFKNILNITNYDKNYNYINNKEFIIDYKYKYNYNRLLLNIIYYYVNKYENDKLYDLKIILKDNFLFFIKHKNNDKLIFNNKLINDIINLNLNLKIYFNYCYYKYDNSFYYSSFYKECYNLNINGKKLINNYNIKDLIIILKYNSKYYSLNDKHNLNIICLLDNEYYLFCEIDKLTKQIIKYDIIKDLKNIDNIRIKNFYDFNFLHKNKFKQKISSNILLIHNIYNDNIIINFKS